VGISRKDVEAFQGGAWRQPDYRTGEVEAAVASLPPLYIQGFTPSISEGLLTLGAGEAAVEGVRVETDETLITESLYVTPMIGGLSYYVYLSKDSGFLVDVIEPESNEETRVLSHKYRSGRYICYFTLDSDKDVTLAHKALPSELSTGDLSNATARDDLAEQLGYTDYATMVTTVSSDGSIITAGGYLRADLIEASAITAEKIASGAVTTAKLDAEAVTSAKVATGTLQALFAAISELAVGYDGSGSYASPSEGDYSLYIEDARIFLQQYLGGGWSDVNKLTFGVLVGSLVLGMVGCRGVVHPDASATDLTELIPAGDFHHFTFETDYTDQNGNAPDILIEEARSSSWSKFGTYSFFATAGQKGFARFDGGFTLSSPIGASLWTYCPSSSASSHVSFVYFDYYIDVNNQLWIALHWNPTEEEVQLIFTEKQSGTNIQEETLAISAPTASFCTGDHYLACVYDADAGELTLIYDGEVETGTVSAISISGAFSTSRALFTSYNNYDNRNSYIDDVLFAYDDKCDPDLFVRHYNSGVAWQTEGLKYGDVILKPAAGSDVAAVTDDGVIPIASTVYALLNSAQTLAGVKTFSSIPVLPASDPTADNEAARKAYVDAQSAPTPVTTETGNTTPTASERVVVMNNSSAATVTLDTSLGSGVRHTIKRINSGSVTLSPNSGDIDGQSSITIGTKYSSAEVVCDGTNWHIV